MFFKLNTSYKVHRVASIQWIWTSSSCSWFKDYQQWRRYRNPLSSSRRITSSLTTTPRQVRTKRNFWLKYLLMIHSIYFVIYLYIISRVINNLKKITKHNTSQAIKWGKWHFVPVNLLDPFIDAIIVWPIKSTPTPVKLRVNIFHPWREISLKFWHCLSKLLITRLISQSTSISYKKFDNWSNFQTQLLVICTYVYISCT